MSTITDTFIAPPCHDQIEILYQDDHLVLINKPAGLLSLSGKNPQNLDSVHHRLVQIFPGCALVHRTDFGTSGLMVVARNKAANAALCRQFSERTVSKVYSALLCGHLADNEGVIDAAIAKDPALFPLMSICALHGKPARSRYRVVERFYREAEDGISLPLTRVQLTPETGRTHQLRIHSRQLGHPILGCDLYGGRLLPGTEKDAAADAARQRAGLCAPRQWSADRRSSRCAVLNAAYHIKSSGTLKSAYGSSSSCSS